MTLIKESDKTIDGIRIRLKAYSLDPPLHKDDSVVDIITVSQIGDKLTTIAGVTNDGDIILFPGSNQPTLEEAIDVFKAWYDQIPGPPVYPNPSLN